jgi:hypothetical protein
MKTVDVTFQNLDSSEISLTDVSAAACLPHHGPLDQSTSTAACAVKRLTFGRGRNSPTHATLSAGLILPS